MLPRLPPHIAPHYRPATCNDIRAESFGALTAARVGGDPDDWRRHRGTVDDQAIFGTRHPHRCACGKYRGAQYDNLICERCGVRTGDPETLRRSQCAHINLQHPITHPLGDATSQLQVIPVLPAVYIESPAGQHLVRAYDQIVRATTAHETTVGFEALLTALTPPLIIAHDWNLTDRPLIAHGMALKPSAPSHADPVARLC